MSDHPVLEDEYLIQRRTVLAAERRRERLALQELLHPTRQGRK